MSSEVLFLLEHPLDYMIRTQPTFILFLVRTFEYLCFGCECDHTPDLSVVITPDFIMD